MIYISQSYPNSETVVLNVEGDLDSESLPVLVETYRESLESCKAIEINLEKISVVDRDGKAYLRQIRDKVRFVGMPASIRMEIGVR